MRSHEDLDQEEPEETLQENEIGSEQDQMDDENYHQDAAENEDTEVNDNSFHNERDLPKRVLAYTSLKLLNFLPSALEVLLMGLSKVHVGSGNNSLSLC